MLYLPYYVFFSTSMIKSELCFRQRRIRKQESGVHVQDVREIAVWFVFFLFVKVCRVKEIKEEIGGGSRCGTEIEVWKMVQAG